MSILSPQENISPSRDLSLEHQLRITVNDTEESLVRGLLNLFYFIRQTKKKKKRCCRHTSAVPSILVFYCDFSNRKPSLWGCEHEIGAFLLFVMQLFFFFFFFCFFFLFFFLLLLYPSYCYFL